VISKVNTGSKLVALTFDDGPSPRLSKILALLERHDARATFFTLTGRLAGQQMAVQDIVTQGSEVANHTSTHPRLESLSPGSIESELRKSQEEIRQVLGRPSPYVRPSGCLTAPVAGVAKKLGVPVLMYSIDSGDGGREGAKAISERVVRAAGPGEIILMHENGRRTMEALPAILSGLKAKGYGVVTVGELLAAGTVT